MVTIRAHTLMEIQVHSLEHLTTWFFFLTNITDVNQDIPLYCDVSSACVYNSVRSNIGCCPDTSTTCSIWTTCLDSSEKNLFTTDNGYTLWWQVSVFV